MTHAQILLFHFVYLHAHPLPRQWFAGFDWEALAARRLQPPRVPQESDFAKRKAELEATHAAAAPPAVSPAELAEADRIFADF